MKIELWTKDCYGCDRHGKYDGIRNWIVNQGLPLDCFSVKRIQLNPQWTKEAQTYDVELPFLRFTDEKGVRMITYKEWLKDQDVQVVELEKPTKKRRKATKKTTAMKREAIKTADMGDKEDGEQIADN